MPATASAKPAPAKILRLMEELSHEELDRMLPRILELKARKHPRALPGREAQLARKISAGPPAKWVTQYKSLILKRRSHGLSALEQRQVERIADALEAFDAEWVGWLTELADLRGLSVPALMKTFDLRKSEYV